MTFTVDTNLLLYASDRLSPLNPAAVAALERFAAGKEIFYLFWPVIMGYLRISTHHAIFDEPLSAAEARANLKALVERSNVRTPGETDRFWQRFEEVTNSVPTSGNLVTDAHIVSLMLEHGATTIYSRDRDFKKFDGIKSVDPFAG